MSRMTRIASCANTLRRVAARITPLMRPLRCRSSRTATANVQRITELKSTLTRKLGFGGAVRHRERSAWERAVAAAWKASVRYDKPQGTASPWHQCLTWATWYAMSGQARGFADVRPPIREPCFF